MMDNLLRQQYANAQTAFARRRQGMQPMAVPPSAPAAPDQAARAAVPAWLLHPPGQPAPREHFNFEPGGDGSWRIYPPGVQAPAHGPQGTMPTMPPSYDHVQKLGNDIHRQFGQGATPPVPGPFPTAAPVPLPQRPRPRPAPDIAGIV